MKRYGATFRDFIRADRRRLVRCAGRHDRAQPDKETTNLLSYAHRLPVRIPRRLKTMAADLARELEAKERAPFSA